MQAAVITSPRQVELREIADPEPGAGQVRIRVAGTGVCGSNLPVWEGRPWFNYPLAPGAPGHEPWGTVDAIGEGVCGLGVGQSVVFLSEHAFAQYATADADVVVPLDGALSSQPFPGEPLACAVNVFRRSQIQAGERVAIVGVGFLGALLVAMTRAAGAHVLAISRRTSALGLAEQMGAHETRALHHDQLRHDAGTYSCAIEAVGEQHTLDLASELVGERGRLIIAGYHQDGPRQVNMQSWNWRGLDVINAHERDPQVYATGLREGVRLVASGAIDPRPLYTHTFPLADLAHAFEAAASRPDGFMKALVVL